MKFDLDNLIRNAKPATNDLARQRVIAQVVPAFVAPVSGAGSTPWLRIAAALLIAAGSGFAAVTWFAPAPRQAAESSEMLAQMQQDLAKARSRADALNASGGDARGTDSSASRMMPLDQALSIVVPATIDERERVRREQHRESHLAYARKHYQEDMERAITALKRDYALNESQIADVRKVFTEHGAQVETLIGKHYRGGFRGRGRGMPGGGMSGEFEKIIQATESRLAVVLAEVPRNMPGADLAAWGPSPDFATTSDYETWLNWSEEVRQSG